MAWPCITRACCINRFWSELDKADIAVPLVFTKYSDVAEVQHLHPQPQSKQKRTSPITIETQPSHSEQEAAAKAPPATGAASGKDVSCASVMRQDFKAWKVRPEPSCKPKNEYHPSATPFNNKTQYQKDYKQWPIPKKGDHPWIPKPSPTSTGAQDGSVATKIEHATTEQAESGVEKSEIEEKVQEKESKDRKKKPVKKDKTVERKVSVKMEEQPPADVTVEGNGRAAADALNRQIKQVVSTGSSYRNEFKAYKDVKPVKAIKAQSQYKSLVEDKDKASLETSYSANFKGEQAKVQPNDNKLVERRRIRSLYNEPGNKEPSKVDKSASRSKPKKTPTATSKIVKKAKEKQIAGSQSAKKKSSTSTPDSKPEGGITKKSKEISNRLAEANK